MSLLTIADLATASDELKAEVGVRDRLVAYLDSQNTEPDCLQLQFSIGRTGRRTKVYHASSVGGADGRIKTDDGREFITGCARRLYYERIGAAGTQNFDARVRCILDTGTAVHAQLQGYCHAMAKRLGDVFADEVDVDPEVNPVAKALGISGHCDGIYTTGSARFGLEFKTAGSWVWGNTVEEEWRNGQKVVTGFTPKTEHLVQATIYQKCLDLPAMVILYYEKDRSRFAEHVQWFDAGLWHAIERKLLYVEQRAKKLLPPAREECTNRRNPWSCSGCPFRVQCDPDVLKPKKKRSKAA